MAHVLIWQRNKQAFSYFMELQILGNGQYKFRIVVPEVSYETRSSGVYCKNLYLYVNWTVWFVICIQ